MLIFEQNNLIYNVEKLNKMFEICVKTNSDKKTKTLPNMKLNGWSLSMAYCQIVLKCREINNKRAHAAMSRLFYLSFNSCWKSLVWRFTTSTSIISKYRYQCSMKTWSRSYEPCQTYMDTLQSFHTPTVVKDFQLRYCV